MQRRDFIFLSTVLGLSQILGPKRAIAELLCKEINLTHENAIPGDIKCDFQGRIPILQDHGISGLIERVMNGQICPEYFLSELQKRFGQMDLKQEIGTHADPAVNQSFEIRRLCKQKFNKDSASEKSVKIQLFFIPPGMAHPPHGHSNLISLQTVLSGTLKVIEFNRIRDEGSRLIVKPVSDIVVGTNSDFQIPISQRSFACTEHENNVHWFGAHGSEPSLVFNFNIQGTYLKENLFKSPEARENIRDGHARYYLDGFNPQPVPGSSGHYRIAKIDETTARQKYQHASPCMNFLSDTCTGA